MDDLRGQIEGLVDNYGVIDVLASLQMVCQQKSGLARVYGRVMDDDLRAAWRRIAYSLQLAINVARDEESQVG